MNNLKENYEQALECINDMLKYNKYDKEETIRLKTKASCYRTFLNELNQVLNIDVVIERFEKLTKYDIGGCTCDKDSVMKPLYFDIKEVEAMMTEFKNAL